MAAESSTALLAITAVRGRSLVARDANGTSDPYLVLRLSSGSANDQRSKVIKKTLNPEWNEALADIAVTAEDLDQAVIEIECWDKDFIGSDDFMGETRLRLSAVSQDGLYSRHWLKLGSRLRADGSEMDDGITGDIEIMCQLKLGAAASAKATSSKKPRAAIAYLAPPPAFLAALPRIVEPLDEMLVDVPVALMPPENIARDHYLEMPHANEAWYSRFIRDMPHEVFVGHAADLGGTVVLAVARTESAVVGQQLWVVALTQKAVVHQCIDLPLGSEAVALSDVLPRLGPKYEHAAKAFMRLRDDADPAYKQALARIEDPEAADRIKVGVLFARDGQTRDDEMFSNVDGSPAFEQFLDLLGERVRLKGFTGYAAQLDVSADGSGLTSVYRRDFHGYEVMFHVSTLLRYDAADPQRVQRKRFIGNDIVVVVFMDGTSPYSVDTMKSQYTRVLIVVQPDPEHADRYRVATAYAKEVRSFGPPSYAYCPKTRDGVASLLCKAINGEKATKASPEFVIREQRTRKEYLDMFHKDYSAALHKAARITAVPRPLEGTRPQAPQRFTCTPLVAGLSMAVSSFDDTPEYLFFGTATGLYRLWRQDRELLQVLPMRDINSIQIDAGAGLLFVRTGPTTPRMFSVALAPLLERSPSSVHVDALVVRGGSGESETMRPSHFASGAIGEQRYLFVAHDETVTVMQITQGPAGAELARVRQLHQPARVTALAVVGQGLVVGTAGVPGGAGSVFSFFSVPEFAAVELAVGEPGEDCMGAFVRPNGLLLAFSAHGVMLDRDGRVVKETVFRWAARPVCFSVKDDCLFVFFTAFLHVLGLSSGAVIETHPIPTPARFANARDEGSVYLPLLMANGKTMIFSMVAHGDRGAEPIHVSGEIRVVSAAGLAKTTTSAAATPVGSSSSSSSSSGSSSSS